MEIDNIDDLLHNQAPKEPKSLEVHAEDNPEALDLYGNEASDSHVKEALKKEVPQDVPDEPEEEAQAHEEDEYGNAKERMSKGMQDRLDRKDKAHQREMQERQREINELRAELARAGASRQVQQAAKDFEYDPNEAGDWQQQLASFVKQTVNEMTHEQARTQREAQERANHEQFAKRFTQGMDKFQDFKEVVSSQPIDDAMTLALRGMDDPASFIYAAAKRQPEELSRISRLADPYARMVEMGKLEERMRRNKPSTQAPRPVSRPKEDSVMPDAPKAKREETIEDRIAASDAKRLEQLRTRRQGIGGRF